MPKKSSLANFAAAATAAKNMSHQDREAESNQEKNRLQRITVILQQIKKREEDTRPINESHVKSLVESIAVLGLIEPIVVDRQNRLLAGGHRLAAIQQLKQENLSAYKQHFSEDAIPVRIMPFDAEEDPERALQCEVAENEHRRDYTPAEVRILAERLKKGGFKRLKGRPAKGEKSLVLALAFVVNKSKRTIERYLKEETEEKQKSATSDALLAEQKNLRKIHKSLLNWQKATLETPDTPKRASLAKKLPGMLKLIDAAIAEIKITEIDTEDEEK